MRVRLRRLNLGGKSEAAATCHEEARATATGEETKFAVTGDISNTSDMFCDLNESQHAALALVPCQHPTLI